MTNSSQNMHKFGKIKPVNRKTSIEFFENRCWFVFCYFWSFLKLFKKPLPDGNHNEPAGDIQMRAAIILIVVVIFGCKRRAWLSEHITTKWAFRTRCIILGSIWLLPCTSITSYLSTCPLHLLHTVKSLSQSEQ